MARLTLKVMHAAIRFFVLTTGYVVFLFDGRGVFIMAEIVLATRPREKKGLFKYSVWITWPGSRKSRWSTFQYLLQEIYFQPLGMKHTGWMLSEVDTTRYITPYVYITEENRNVFLTATDCFPESLRLSQAVLSQPVCTVFPIIRRAGKNQCKRTHLLFNGTPEWR
jgi:hypothetical protein